MVDVMEKQLPGVSSAVNKYPQIPPPAPVTSFFLEDVSARNINN